MEAHSFLKAALLLAAAAAAGCGGTNAAKESEAGSTTAAANQPEASAAPVAPEALAGRLQGSMTDQRLPEKVVQAYFAAVRSSDLPTKLELMTPKARAAWQTYGVEFLNAVSSPNMQVTVTDRELVGATVEELEAHVSIRFTDQDESTGEATTEEAVVWLTPSREGWRVRGLAVPIPPSSTPLVLDYEAPAEVFRRLSAVAAPPEEESVADQSPTPAIR